MATLDPYAKISCAKCLVEACPLKGAGPDIWAFSDTSRIMLGVRKETMLLRQGDVAVGIYIIFQGRFKVGIKGPGEERMLLSFAKSGQILGLRLLGGGSLFPAFATSIEDSVVCFLPQVLVAQLFDSSPGFSKKVIRELARELQRMDLQIWKMAHLSNREKVADALLTVNLAADPQEEGANPDLLVSRKDIAELSGTAPEVVSRILSQFTKEGLIQLDGKKIRILDLAALTQLGGPAA